MLSLKGLIENPPCELVIQTPPALTRFCVPHEGGQEDVVGRCPIDVNEAICLSNRLVKQRALQLCFNVSKMTAAHFDVASVVAQFFTTTEFYPHRGIFSCAVNGAITEGPFRRIEFHWRQLCWPVGRFVVMVP